MRKSILNPIIIGSAKNYSLDYSLSSDLQIYRLQPPLVISCSLLRRFCGGGTSTGGVATVSKTEVSGTANYCWFEHGFGLTMASMATDGADKSSIISALADEGREHLEERPVRQLSKLHRSDAGRPPPDGALGGGNNQEQDTRLRAPIELREARIVPRPRRACVAW